MPQTPQIVLLEKNAFPNLSHVKTSCYPPIAPKKVHGCANVVTPLPVSSQPKDGDSESEGPPELEESSCDEKVSRVKITVDSESDSDASTVSESHNSPKPFLVPKRARRGTAKTLPAAITSDLSAKEKVYKDHMKDDKNNKSKDTKVSEGHTTQQPEERKARRRKRTKTRVQREGVHQRVSTMSSRTSHSVLYAKSASIRRCRKPRMARAMWTIDVVMRCQMRLVLRIGSLRTTQF